MDTKKNAEIVKKVLIADDDKTAQIALKYMFENMGYIAVIAKNGLEAVTLFDETFAIIIMDHNMPEISGIEATQKIRQKEKQIGATKSVYILGLTGYSDEKSTHLSLIAGMNLVAEKPLDYREIKKITLMIDGRQHKPMILNELKAPDPAFV